MLKWNMSSSGRTGIDSVGVFCWSKFSLVVCISGCAGDLCFVTGLAHQCRPCFGGSADIHRTDLWWNPPLRRFHRVACPLFGSAVSVGLTKCLWLLLFPGGYADQIQSWNSLLRHHPSHSHGFARSTLGGCLWLILPGSDHFPG